ncbi:MAG: hypothetical protein AB3N17_19285 [Tateyamaria sp.]
MIYVEQGVTATIRDFWFDGATGRISHVILDLGSWLASDLALATPDRIALGGEDWTLRMRQAELTRAPRWSDPSDAFMSDWPPIIVGPFGNTLSIPLLAAQLKRQQVAGDGIAPVLAEITDAATDFVGAPVFAEDGEMGAVSDLQIDLDAWTVTQLTVEQTAGSLATVAWSDVRRQVDAERGGHVLVNGRRGNHVPTA